MRVIAGAARGRRLFSPGSKGRKGEIRPTSDRAREAIFNVLADRVRGAHVLDLFAGTGALGLEALSRGALSALFVDKGQTAMTLLHKNIHLCGFSDKSVVLKRDLTRSLSFLRPYMPEGGFSLVFVDPPYAQQLSEKIVLQVSQAGVISADVMFVVEASAKYRLPEEIADFFLVDQRVYGEAAFWLYRQKEDA